MSKVDDEEQIKRLASLAALTDEPDTTDIAEAPAGAWAVAETGRFYRPRKEAVTIRIDADVLDWFRHAAGASGYQSAINAALRNHVSKTPR